MSQIAVVIGASRGIGFELSKQLAERGWGVIGTVRGPNPRLEALGVRVEANVDVRNEDAIYGLGHKLKREGVGIDLLVANAGILVPDHLDELDVEALRAQFEVNALGPLRMVHSLAPCLVSGAKVGLMTSRMGSIGDNSSGGYYGYRMSKAALNAAGVSLAKDLAHRDIAVAILHPGFVRTGMTAGHGQLEPSESARMLLDRLDGLNAGNSGTFWHANGDVLPW